MLAQSLDLTHKKMPLLQTETERANPLEYRDLEQPFKVPLATKADFDRRVHKLSDYPDKQIKVKGQFSHHDEAPRQQMIDKLNITKARYERAGGADIGFLDKFKETENHLLYNRRPLK